MGEFFVIELNDDTRASQWDAVISKAYLYDWYHLSGYHRIAQSRGEGKAVLLVYQHSGHLVCLPLLLRR